MDSIITAWTNSIGLSNVTTINGIHIEKQIMVPTSQKYRLQQHLDSINRPLDKIT
jgi:hypothetical protein